MRQQFKKLVIETIHGKPYDEAVKKEEVKGIIVIKGENDYGFIGRPITIGRVMQALNNTRLILDEKRRMTVTELSTWKLTKENGQECTDDDQSDETIKKLLEILK